jgi:carboxypeptidase T
MKLILFFFISLSVLSFSQNYKQVKIYINKQDDIKSLYNAGLEFDHISITKDKAFIAFISDDEYDKLIQTGFRFEILIDDWYKYYNEREKLSESEKFNIIDKSRQNYNVTGLNFGSMGGFYTLAEVYAELDTMRMLFPNLITAKDSLGATIENRPVYMVKISNNPESDEEKPEVLYTALHHAREPEGMMQLIYFMYYLIENYDSDETVKYLVDNRELFFIPVVNPDGYEYNRQISPNGGGMWRKNRRNNGDTFGVDLNRNYGPIEYWDAPNGGSSTSGVSDTYRGTAPFSEPETQIIRDFLAQRNIKCALNYHTYSNLLIYPYGSLEQETADSLIFREFAIDMTAHNGYAVGTDQQTVGYSTRGNSDDYFYDGDTLANSGKIFAMTPEVGNFSDGFWPAQDRIFPLAEENLFPNLYYAWVAGDYVVLENAQFNLKYFIPGDSVELLPEFKNKGLSDAGNITMSIASDNQYINIPEQEIFISEMEPRSSYISTTPFTFTISENAPIEKRIKLVVSVEIGGIEMSSDTITIITGIPVFVFSDSSNAIEQNWTVTASPSIPKWETTTESFYSSPASFTDSKSGNYADNAIVTMALTDPIDLTPYSNPVLTFWTKFDIEANWDYGQVEVSTNGGLTWLPLEGKLTNLGTGSFQPNGQPVYDGLKNTWEREEMDLSDYISDQVKIRFKLVSDGFVNRDGWYIDDIGILIYVPLPVDETKIAADKYSLAQNYPNPFNPQTTINFSLLSEGRVVIKLYNLLGSEIAVLMDEIKSAGNHLYYFNAADFKITSGVYFYSLESGNFKQTKKMIILK